MSNELNDTPKRFPTITPTTIDILRTRFPDEVIKTREVGGGKKVPYIPYGDIVTRLNDAFGFEWSSHVNSIELVGDDVVATVSLLAEGLTKTDVGGAPVMRYADSVWDNSTKSHKPNARAGQVLPEGIVNAYKVAVSDALKRCAMQFEIGNYLRTDHDAPAPAAQQATTKAPPAATPLVEIETPQNDNKPDGSGDVPRASDNQRKALKAIAIKPECDGKPKEKIIAYLDNPDLTFEDASSLIKAVNEYMKTKKEAS